MVKINYQGRFGNNLFQFAAGKVVADRLGLNIENPLDTKILPHQNQFPPDTGDNIYLDGFFQTEKITESFSELKFCKIPEREATFVHVRLGDLLNPHPGQRFMSLDYYIDVINSVKTPAALGYISSDSPEHPIVKELMRKFNLQPYNDSPENTIFFAAGCSHKVLSLGTFSWWIGYLGNQYCVNCPNKDNYPIWHGEIFPMDWNVHPMDYCTIS